MLVLTLKISENLFGVLSDLPFFLELLFLGHKMAIPLNKPSRVDTHERLRNFGWLLKLLHWSDVAVGAYFIHFL